MLLHGRLIAAASLALMAWCQYPLPMTGLPGDHSLVDERQRVLTRGAVTL
jgi:hypothetical protein